MAHEHHDDHHPQHEHRLSYPDAVRAYRADKDAAFRSTSGSPVPADQRAAFAGLPYFDPDEAWVAEGLELEPLEGDQPTSFQIPTTDGRLRPAERAGRLRFHVPGGDGVLTAYRLARSDGTVDDSLFVPFLDATTGTETYGAGRYLDIEPEDDGTWTLDFNLAYHPSCVYDPKFSCPLTPAENRLPFRVEAGERLAEGEAH
jgi:uncharacterized protein (DUF1684 family)